jgi:hypothetical protein
MQLFANCSGEALSKFTAGKFERVFATLAMRGKVLRLRLISERSLMYATPRVEVRKSCIKK